MNSLASSPGRNNFCSRSQHARLLTISKCDVLVTSTVGMGDAEKLHRQVFKKEGVALLQHLLCKDEAESGVNLQSLRSKLSHFLDSTSQKMSITALPAVLQHLCLSTLTHHQCQELLARGEACSGCSSLLEVRGACNVREVAAGAVVLSGSEKNANLNNAEQDTCSDGQEALEQKGKMIGHLRSIINLREERKKVTIYGGYAMAIKRNLSHSWGCGHGRNIGWRRRAWRPQEQGCLTRTCANDTSVASSTPQHDATSTNRVRSSFSNVEVHVLMSDATNEDSVEKSKVTVGFVWPIAASGDAIRTTVLVR